MAGGGWTPGGAGMPATTVELAVRCEDLLDRDLVSRSDPACVLWQRARPQDRWQEVGRTERLQDTLSPAWVNKFTLRYTFEQRQLLRFTVVDIDSSSSDIASHDMLGEVECSLGEVMAQQSRGFVRSLSMGGKIFVQAEEVVQNNLVVTMKFEGVNLDNKDFFGKSDPFFEILRSTENNDYTMVYRSKAISNTLNPSWPSFSVSNSALCNGDEDRALKIYVYDEDSDGSHDLIGCFSTSLRSLLEGPGTKNTYECINEKKRQKKGTKYKNSGTILLKSIEMVKKPSFLNFIQGGTQVNFTVAVDFTASNGKPTDPTSLHYRDPHGRPNQYQTAIRAVGDIIQDYDSDKQFPALGFGARIPPSGQVSHEFFLNLTDNPFCAGMEGVLAAYNSSLHNVQLYGPTNFSPVIRHVAQFANAYQADPTNYFVLLIITDGVITDLEETKGAIIAASQLPLSIIIVGVGDADFTEMELLDGDNQQKSKGQRDIVQFVELKSFVQSDYSWDKERLAGVVLAEVPTQLCSWMSTHGFKPRSVERDMTMGNF